MKHLPIFVLAGVLAAFASGAAQAQDQQKACAEDVVKHCPKATGSADELGKCLVVNKDKLGEACKKAVEAPKG